MCLDKSLRLVAKENPDDPGDESLAIVMFECSGFLSVEMESFN